MPVACQSTHTPSTAIRTAATASCALTSSTSSVPGRGRPPCLPSAAVNVSLGPGAGTGACPYRAAMPDLGHQSNFLQDLRDALVLLLHECAELVAGQEGVDPV